MSFKELQRQWYDKLKSEGFVDIEDARYPKRPDTRTLLYKNHDKVLYFYLKLDDFLTNTQRIPKKHRRILQMHSAGIKTVKVAERMQMAYECVRAIIRKYRALILKS